MQPGISISSHAHTLVDRRNGYHNIRERRDFFLVKYLQASRLKNYNTIVITSSCTDTPSHGRCG
jgi:hypothetical protein